MEGESQEAKNKLMVAAVGEIWKARERKALIELVKYMNLMNPPERQIPVSSDEHDDGSLGRAISKGSELVSMLFKK